MMPVASIVHDAGGFRCARLNAPLPLRLGLDGSAILPPLTALPDGWLVEALDQLFIAAPALTGITLPWRLWQDNAQAQPLFTLAQSDYLARETFWQLPLWLRGGRTAAGETMVWEAERQLYHPRRPPRPEGEVYRRYDARIKRTFSLRVVDLRQDAERFTRWMNTPRVNAFWEMAGPQEAQENYLRRQLDLAHAYPLIGCFDNEPFGYFEVYWTAEDRIGRHYRWQPFDRGLHMLVGEERWRGAPYIRSWLRGLSHYLWLDEPRTGRLVAEPRFDNQRLFRHLPEAGFSTEKEFDFPHKRSRLVISQRDRFFREVAL